MKKKLIILTLILVGVYGFSKVVTLSLSSAEKLVLVEGISNRVISPSILASGFLAHEEEVMLSSEVIAMPAKARLLRLMMLKAKPSQSAGMSLR